jgi:hypothetical protein
MVDGGPEPPLVDWGAGSAGPQQAIGPGLMLGELAGVGGRIGSGGRMVVGGPGAGLVDWGAGNAAPQQAIGPGPMLGELAGEGGTVGSSGIIVDVGPEVGLVDWGAAGWLEQHRIGSGLEPVEPVREGEAVGSGGGVAIVDGLVEGTGPGALAPELTPVVGLEPGATWIGPPCTGPMVGPIPVGAHEGVGVGVGVGVGGGAGEAGAMSRPAGCVPGVSGIGVPSPPVARSTATSAAVPAAVVPST